MGSLNGEPASPPWAYTSLRASENPAEPEVTLLQVMAVQPSFPRSAVLCLASPHVHTPSVLSPWSCLALPTWCLVLFPPEWVLPNLTGTAEQTTGRAGLRQPVCAHPFISTSCLESCLCISCGPRGTWVVQSLLREEASASAKDMAVWPRLQP